MSHCVCSTVSSVHQDRVTQEQLVSVNIKEHISMVCGVYVKQQLVYGLRCSHRGLRCVKGPLSMDSHHMIRYLFD